MFNRLLHGSSSASSATNRIEPQQRGKASPPASPDALESDAYKAALAVLNNAIAREERCDITGAVEQYTIALNALLQCMKSTTNLAAKDRIRAVIATYMSRAELLKQRAHSHTPISITPNPIQNAANSIENLQPRHDWLQGIDPNLVRNVENEVLTSSTGVSFTNIIGLDTVKQALRESVIIPILRPDLFTGIRRPPRGILLYGPPGGGKVCHDK